MSIYFQATYTTHHVKWVFSQYIYHPPPFTFRLRVFVHVCMLEVYIGRKSTHKGV